MHASLRRERRQIYNPTNHSFFPWLGKRSCRSKRRVGWDRDPRGRGWMYKYSFFSSLCSRNPQHCNTITFQLKRKKLRGNIHVCSSYLEEGLVNCDPRGSCLLLGNSHIYLFMYCVCICAITAELSGCDRDHMAPIA